MFSAWDDNRVSVNIHIATKCRWPGMRRHRCVTVPASATQLLEFCHATRKWVGLFSRRTSAADGIGTSIPLYIPAVCGRADDGLDRHCRYFHRLLAPHARLYTELCAVDGQYVELIAASGSAYSVVECDA
jgi:hypothetical protein